MQYLPFGKDEGRMTKEQARKLHCTVEAALALQDGVFAHRPREVSRADRQGDGQVGRGLVQTHGASGAVRRRVGRGCAAGLEFTV